MGYKTLLTALVVFSAMAALDYVWALYTYAIGRKNPWLSGGYASAIILLGGIGTIGYVSDKWMMVPAMMGAFAGTFLAVRTARG